jgi:hypothetical protein
MVPNTAVQKQGETKKIVFDTVLTLMVIKGDKALHEIFDSKADLDLLILTAKNKTLTDKSYNRLNEFFDRIIKLNNKPLRAYTKLWVETNREEVTEEVIEGVKKPIRIPKHYGKQRILSDIKANNGRTELDRAMLSLNTMRNLYATLKRRGIKDKLTGSKSLTTEDCRLIVATVRTLENKISKITKKKK